MSVEINVALLSGDSMSMNCSLDSLLVEVKVTAQLHFKKGFLRLVSASSTLLDPMSTVRDLGENRSVTAIPHSVTVSSMKFGESFFAISSSGHVVPWGQDNYVPQGLQDVRCIHVATYACAAIRFDGTVASWGVTDQGGDGSEVQSPLTDVVQLQATSGAFAAIRADGTVVTWGNPDEGGDSSQVQEQLTQVVHIQASAMGFAAIKADGQVVTWGGPSPS